MAAPLTAERLRALLDYDPVTGVFRWRVSKRKCIAGQPAGGIRGNGYLGISLNNTKHYSHRLAWLHVHGVWPKGQIDHINGVKTDNRIANLRDATASQNGQNRRVARADSGSGMIGVRYIQETGRWFSEIRKNGKKFCLGTFDTKDAAHAAYLAAKSAIHEYGDTAKSFSPYIPERIAKNRNINPKKGSDSGVIGASKIKKNGKWRARLSIGRKEIHLGCFDTAEEAGAAYRAALSKLTDQCE